MSYSYLGSFNLFIFPFWYKCLCEATEKEVYTLLIVLQDSEYDIREAPMRHVVLSKVPLSTLSISQKWDADLSRLLGSTQQPYREIPHHL